MSTSVPLRVIAVALLGVRSPPAALAQTAVRYRLSMVVLLESR